jgi:membrane-associated phospholipid phosphatase
VNIESRQTLLQRIVRQVQCSSPFIEWMCAFILFGGLILFIFPKTSIHIFVNQFHSPGFDTFFEYATFLGDGISATILVVILFFVRFRYAIMVAASNISCSIIVQSLKRLFFSDSVRPYQFFKGIHHLYIVPGVEVYSFNSFPSGHSATIFTTCMLLCLITKRRLLRVLLFIIAFIIAFSRVYLSQHFFVDIYAGAIIGVVVAYGTATYLNKESDTPTWFEYSLTTILE